MRFSAVCGTLWAEWRDTCAAESSEGRLKAFLLAGGDCEALGADEYVADLYDAEKPLTVNLKETEKGFELLAAAEMLFDEEMDGWYMGERVEDAEMVERALRNAMNDGRA